MDTLQRSNEGRDRWIRAEERAGERAEDEDGVEVFEDDGMEMPPLLELTSNCSKNASCNSGSLRVSSMVKRCCGRWKAKPIDAAAEGMVEVDRGLDESAVLDPAVEPVAGDADWLRLLSRVLGA